MVTGRAEQAVDLGVQQVAEQLHDRLAQYLEARYHIRDEGIINERRKLLEEPGSISQPPFIETTPTYETDEPYKELGLPAPVGEVLSELANWSPGIGVFPHPYVHQAQALRALLVDGQDIVVATGTGSGKTETFLFPILGQFLLEAAHRPATWQMPGCRALLLYPMNALVSDQLARLRRLFGDERLADLFANRYGRFPRFAMYTSRTPYPGPRTADKDRRYIEPVLRYYLDLERQAESGASERAHLVHELRERGRWPAKNLRAFAANGYQTQPDDRELLTRHEIHACCPDIIVTNHSMLEYMLLRPIERSIFAQTRDWLAADERNVLTLVLDEAHVYRGASGAEVGLLMRRLAARLEVPRDRLRCILTSASIGNHENEEAIAAVHEFASGLVGRPGAGQKSFRVITGVRERCPSARAATAREISALAAFDLPALYARAIDPKAAEHAVATLAAKLGWPAPDGDLRRYLYDRLRHFGPVELIIDRTAGHAMSFAELASVVAPNTPQDDAEAATMALLALGALAHNGTRSLLPTRAHLLFRGLPALYACINPRCNRRRYRPGEPLLLGRLYTEPRTHCDCDLRARVYELVAHRDCGAAFLKVYGRSSDASFYWHERGGTVEPVGEPLDEIILLLEEPHPSQRPRVLPIWIDLTTGRVRHSPPPESERERHRLCYRPNIRRSNRPHRQSAGRLGEAFASPESLGSRVVGFADCPACTKQHGGRKIVDFATKGDQPFASLVREQFDLQPALRTPDKRHPNAGRKVLLFSDGRQKAARLARDLPREVEFDSFRQAIALAARRLEEIDWEPILDVDLYVAFVAVCHEYRLYFFEGSSQQQLIEEMERFGRYYDGDLLEAIRDRRRPTPPVRYQQALLRQLSDPFHSLHAVGAAVIRPSRRSLRHLQRDLAELPDRIQHDLSAIATVWIQEMLEKAAFDPTLSDVMRREICESYQPVEYGAAIGNLEKLLQKHGSLDADGVRILREKLYDVLTERDREGNAVLNPTAVAIAIAIDDVWYRCRACGLLQAVTVLGRCGWCGEAEIEKQPPDHAQMAASVDYFRRPIRAVLRGRRPIHLVAEEHTAQLSHRDVGVVHATTEEFELRFQDVELGPDKPPVDVLSCTTTMEVGIDIGSLTAIGLRNVPPQRENYQQRAGRAGRRGTAVSTVVTYAQDGPHDSHYYRHPEGMISGPPREPRVNIDNRRLARRHIHSYLIQTFFHHQLDRLPDGQLRREARTSGSLFDALGNADAFFAGDGEFSLAAFDRWVREEIIEAGNANQELWSWLPDELFPEAFDPEALLAEKRRFVVETAVGFVRLLESIGQRQNEQQGRQSVQEIERRTRAGEAENESEETRRSSLLDVLFGEGLLPSYAFPTELCSFYVFQYEDGRVRIRERPEQAKVKALSEYAPGRLLVVNKETFRVGGIYAPGAKTASPARRFFAGGLTRLVSCPRCTYVRVDRAMQPGERCRICDSPLQEWEMLDPPGFAPQGGRPLRERDRDQDFSYATEAQLPTPIEPERFEWRQGGTNLLYAHGEDQQLVVVNYGPDGRGFAVCEACGAAKPYEEGELENQHPRPFLIESYVLQREAESKYCRGPVHPSPVVLGHMFRTDLLLVRLALRPPLAYDPQYPWLHSALRSTAEAIALAASLHLDIDPGELSAGYRLISPTPDYSPDTQALADIYLYDTAAGGAGYAAEAGDQLDRVLERALNLLKECPAICARSCTNCLRHYGNRIWHGSLDRHLAAQLIEFAYSGDPPSIPAAAVQSEQLAPLQRFLELEGWRCERNLRVGDSVIPLALTGAPRGALMPHRPLIVGTYPSLLDSTWSEANHPLAVMGLPVILLNDYVVDRDLPTAHLELCRKAGITT